MYNAHGHTHCITQVLKAHVLQVLFVSIQLGVVVISQSLQLLATTYTQHNTIDALPLLLFSFKMEREGGGKQEGGKVEYIGMCMVNL